ncbi:MAG TPA: Sip1-related alpha-galactosidase [Polyangiaceae bacterium]
MELRDRTLADADRTLFAPLDEGLALEPDVLGNGAFLVATAKATSSRVAFSLGALPLLDRFTACHRYEPYWMKPCAGEKLAEVPPETQSFVARLRDGAYLLAVPLLDELTRFSLRGRPEGTLALAGETGDAFTPTRGGLALYVAVGSDPFELTRRGAESVMKRLGTGRLRRDKPYPAGFDDFGWCTWDAFYQEVSESNVVRGLESFRAISVEPRFLILDDGWQSIAVRPTGEKRLTAFAANQKFPGGLRPFVERCKRDYGIRTFIVWHAMQGYWGGVDGEALGGYGVVEQTRQFGDGVLFHMPAFNHEWWGSLVGFVPAANVARFFDDYHRLLAAEGVDGVKVDSQAVLEGLATGQGGRVPVTRAYRKGLEASTTKHFSGRLINCMSNAQETYYGSPDSTLLRTSIDFFPALPASHGAHLYANAQVGVWFGEFMQPDWDMFQSGHTWGAFHAAGRAVSGGPVYVSDKPEAHDSEVLRRLVCSDGSVLRCDEPGRPTLDVLLSDPTREDVLLKIWNRAGKGGVVGVFNARVGAEGAEGPELSGETGPSDVPGLAGNAFASFRFVAQALERLAPNERRTLALGERGYEVFTFVPVEREFAAVGLAGKLNAHGAVRSVSWSDDRTVIVALADGGAFVAYSKACPLSVEGLGGPLRFEHDAATGTLRVSIERTGRVEVTIRF